MNHSNITPNDNIRINIIWLRKQHNLSQQQLANLLEVNRSLLGAWEEGRAVPRYEQLLAVADYFKVLVDTLLRTDMKKGYVVDKIYEVKPRLTIEIK